jgi:hypothetical protein
VCHQREDRKLHRARQTYTARRGARDGAAYDEEAKSYRPVYWFDAKGEDGSNALVQAKLITPSDGQPARLAVIDVFPYGDAGHYGDAVQESRMPQGPALPVASLTGRELGEAADILALGKAAGAWYRANLRGQSVTNAATGWKVRFTKSGEGKTAGGKGEDLYRLVPALREIVASGILIGTEPDSQGRRQITAIHTFAATVELDGVTKEVTIKVREAQDGRMFYDLNRDMSDGARFSLPSSPVMDAGARGEVPTVRAEYSAVDPALEGNPVNLNIEFREPAGKREDAPQGWGEVEADPLITDEAVAAVTRDLNAELARSGLAGKASVRVVRGLTGVCQSSCRLVSS